MAKREAKKQHGVRKAGNDKRIVRKGKRRKQNNLTRNNTIDNFFKRFWQISQQYERIGPSTKRTLRMLSIYSGLVETLANQAIEKADTSMSREEIAKLYKQTVTGIRDAGEILLPVWWMKVGATPERTQAKSRQAAEIAAHDVKASAPLIGLCALEGDERFFIYLGRYLSGEMRSSTLPDKLDFCLWWILRRNPWIKSADAVRELRKDGFTMTEEAFRMRKKRMGFAKLTRLFQGWQSRKA
jgi:hypothetical protein